MIASFEDASKDELGARSVPSRLVRCLVNRRRYGQDAMKKARECPASFPIAQGMRKVEATMYAILLSIKTPLFLWQRTISG